MINISYHTLSLTMEIVLAFMRFFMGWKIDLLLFLSYGKMIILRTIEKKHQYLFSAFQKN